MKRIIKGLAALLLLASGASGVLVGKVYSDIQRALSQTHVTVRQEKESNVQRHESSTNSAELMPRREQTAVSEQIGRPLNILLLGSDADHQARKEEEGYVGRTDTMMIVSVNPKTRSTKLLSIPRDTYVNIEGLNFPDKINHSYAYGGVALAVDTVEKFLDVPIDYYAVVNMGGLIELIDAVGGIDVTSPLTFNYRGTGFVKGERRHVNGVKAMNFARMRYDDPDGEVGRQNRQKMVIKELIDKLVSVNSIASYSKLLEVVARNIQTDLDLKQAVSLISAYFPAMQNISSVKFETLEDLYVGDGFYFYIPLNARVKVANELRQHTAQPSITRTNLKDPLDNDVAERATKTTTIIVNQYPTGVSREQLAQILQTNEVVQRVRATEYYVPEQVVPPAVVEERQFEVTSNYNTTNTDGGTPSIGIFEVEETLPERVFEVETEVKENVVSEIIETNDSTAE